MTRFLGALKGWTGVIAAVVSASLVLMLAWVVWPTTPPGITAGGAPAR